MESVYYVMQGNRFARLVWPPIKTKKPRSLAIRTMTVLAVHMINCTSGLRVIYNARGQAIEIEFVFHGPWTTFGRSAKNEGPRSKGRTPA